jgi:hypothetical protein
LADKGLFYWKKSISPAGGQGKIDQAERSRVVRLVREWKEEARNYLGNTSVLLGKKASKPRIDSVLPGKGVPAAAPINLQEPEGLPIPDEAHPVDIVRMESSLLSL